MQQSGKKGRTVVERSLPVGSKATIAIYDNLVSAYQELESLQKSGTGVSEQDTRSRLIDPVLEYLGHEKQFRSLEQQHDRNIPDVIIYRGLVSKYQNRQCDIILEAKALGKSLEGKEHSRAYTPHRQIRRYLKYHRASGDGTIGILTNGTKYQLYKRIGNDENPNIEYLNEYTIIGSENGEQVLADLKQELGRSELIQRKGKEAIKIKNQAKYDKARYIISMIENTPPTLNKF